MGSDFAEPDTSDRDPRITLQRRFRAAWAYEPPAIVIIAQPMPGTPFLSLSGCGVTDVEVSTLEAELLSDYQKKTGHYYAYVADSEKEEADTYKMAGWEILAGSQGAKHTVIVYYEAVNPYATVCKHMPDLAADYRQAHPLEFVDLDALEDLLLTQ